MASPTSLLAATRFGELARELERTRWAVELLDPDWRLVWVSPEMRALIGEEDEDKLGYGRPFLETRLNETWRRTITGESQRQATLELFPRMISDAPESAEALFPMIDDEQLVRSLREVEPGPPQPIWSGHIDFVQGDLPPLRVNLVGVRLYDDTGERLGTAFIYGPGLPATLLALVARGDSRMFQRMARLFEPGVRRAAVLFADLQSSGALSRRLPSSVYFNLIRAINTAIDEVVIRHRGIVGKHAGDGVTAFFLADDLGSVSAAARAGIEAAREASAAAREAAEGVAAASGADVGGCMLNAGVHWGGALYMGQVITGGRLEVTALGDEVNECARIQESARDGELLASKSLVERLEQEDARSLGFDPGRVAYRPVGELPSASDKAIRDAGAVPVTALPT